MPRGRAEFRHHGAADGRAWRRCARHALLGRARCVTAERNGPEVFADERLPFGALAEAGLQPRKRCPPVLIRRSPDRAAPNLPFRTTRSVKGPRGGWPPAARCTAPERRRQLSGTVKTAHGVAMPRKA